jgi:hypothetical protein
MKLRSRLALFPTIAAALAATGQAWSQSAKKSKAVIAPLQSAGKEVRRAVFSGNEVRLGMLWAVEENCQGAPVPDVRILKQPPNGELTFREMDSVIELRKDNVRARCNGKPITGVGVFYKSRSDYTGMERMEIEVDYKIGLLRRYTFVINVR